MPEKPRRKPPTIRLRSVTPSLTVNDLQRSLTWYTEVLGFHVKETFDHDGKPGGATLVAGTVEWFLAQDDFARGRNRAKGVGTRFWCGTSQNLEELAAAIEERGGTLTQEIIERPWGTRDFTVTDPDGFVLSFVDAGGEPDA